MLDKHNIIDMLEKIYQESYYTDEYKDLVTALEAIKINSLVSYYINYKDDYDSDDLTIIEFIVKILQNIYNNSSDCESPISDEDYDILNEILITGTNKIISGYDNIKNKIIVNHRYPDLRGTLKKAHFLTNEEKGKDKRKSIEDWINTIRNSLGRDLRGKEWNIRIFPKFDGVSVVFECDAEGNVQRAITRGDTSMNEATDITSLFSFLKFKPFPGWDSEFGVKTEVVMTDPNYKKLCEKYTKYNNRRSAVSSIINRDPDQKFLKYLTIVPLRMQNFNTKEIINHPDAMEVYPYMDMELNQYAQLLSPMSSVREYVETIMQIPIDGAVIQLQDPIVQNALGRKDAVNLFELAYKFKPKSTKTVLLDVEFCMGILGAVAPVAKIAPVVMNGNTIRNVSLGSIDRFESLHLHRGDEVLIKYDIIPYLDVDDTCKKSNSELIKAPTHCVYCGEKLINDPILRCTNNECTSRVMGKIQNYVEKMNIANISIGTITALFKAGYLRSVEDLYRLKNHKSDIAELDGFGAKSVDKMLKSISSRKSVFDYVLLGSLGIPDVSIKIFKRILNIYYIDELMEICIKSDVKKLTDIHGIKEKTANKIIVGIISNMKLIEFLRKELEVGRDAKRYSMKVLFTKVRPDERFEKFLDDKGIEVLSGYNKSVDLVITNDKNGESSKLEKARKDGKDILTLEEAYKAFGFNNG